MQPRLPYAQTPRSGPGIRCYPYAASHAFLILQLTRDFPSHRQGSQPHQVKGAQPTSAGRRRWGPSTEFFRVFSTNWTSAGTSQASRGFVAALGICGFFFQDTKLINWGPLIFTTGHLQGCNSDYFCLKGTYLKNKMKKKNSSCMTTSTEGLGMLALP